MPRTKPPVRRKSADVLLRIKRKDTVRRRYAKDAGRTTGCSVMQFWALLFELNEKNPRHKKLTDEMILAAFANEFPGRTCTKRLVDRKVTINVYRCWYNAGRCTGGKKPDYPSFRYDLDGDPINVRSGMKMTADEVEQRRQMHAVYDPPPIKH